MSESREKRREKSSAKDGTIQETGVLIAYMHDLSAFLHQKTISRKMVALASAVLVLAGLLGMRYGVEGRLVPTTSNAGGKDLPIYCVQTDAPKIALTFDAAWGNGSLGELTGK